PRRSYSERHPDSRSRDQPLPTVRRTFAPGASFRPGFGFCASTLPRLRFAEALRVTFPTVQWARLIRAFAFLSVSPTSFGTTHFALKVAVAARSPAIDSEQLAFPVHAPRPPAHTE